MNQHANVYERITNQIIEAIERGAEAYKMPWHCSDPVTCSPVNASSEKPYRGINMLSLWAAADRAGFPTGRWATYKQWQELGAQVRRGEKASLVVFWKFPDARADVEEDESDGKPHGGFLVRGYCVFNAAQVDG